MQALIHRLALNALMLVFAFTLTGGPAWAAPDTTKLLNFEISTQTFFPSDSSSDQAPGQSSNAPQRKGALEGSLLGKLLFDQPFERASLVDIAVILLIALIISKIISRPGSKKGKPFSNQNQNDSFYNPNEEDKKSGPAAPPPNFNPWARYESKQPKDAKPNAKPGKTIPFPGPKSPRQKPIPEAYSTQSLQPQMESYPEDNEFLKGAKLIYARIHEAWKNQELDFIEHFTSPTLYQQFLQKDKEDYMEIVKVDAKIINEDTLNGDPFITVEFTVLAHKSKQAGPPSEITETWAFLEPASTGTWRLEEIQ